MDRPVPRYFYEYVHQFICVLLYSHRADHLCAILTGQNFCVLFSQGNTFVSYSHRATLLCPILTRQNFCVLFSQGNTFVSYSHRDADEQITNVRPIRTLGWNLHGRLHGRLHGCARVWPSAASAASRTHLFIPDVRIGHKSVAL